MRLSSGGATPSTPDAVVSRGGDPRTPDAVVSPGGATPVPPDAATSRAAFPRFASSFLGRSTESRHRGGLIVSRDPTTGAGVALLSPGRPLFRSLGDGVPQVTLVKRRPPQVQPQEVLHVPGRSRQRVRGHASHAEAAVSGGPSDGPDSVRACLRVSDHAPGSDPILTDLELWLRR